MKKRMIPVLIAIVLIIVMGGIGAVSILLGKYSYSDVMMNLEEYYNLTKADQVAIVHGNEHIETKAKLNQGVYYLDFDSVQKLLNEGHEYIFCGKITQSEGYYIKQCVNSRVEISKKLEQTNRVKKAIPILLNRLMYIMLLFFYFCSILSI